MWKYYNPTTKKAFKILLRMSNKSSVSDTKELCLNHFLCQIQPKVFSYRQTVFRSITRYNTFSNNFHIKFHQSQYLFSVERNKIKARAVWVFRSATYNIVVDIVYAIPKLNFYLRSSIKYELLLQRKIVLCFQLLNKYGDMNIIKKKWKKNGKREIPFEWLIYKSIFLFANKCWKSLFLWKWKIKRFSDKSVLYGSLFFISFCF